MNFSRAAARKKKKGGPFSLCIANSMFGKIYETHHRLSSIPISMLLLHPGPVAFAATTSIFLFPPFLAFFKGSVEERSNKNICSNFNSSSALQARKAYIRSALIHEILFLNYFLSINWLERFRQDCSVEEF